MPVALHQANSGMQENPGDDERVVGELIEITSKIDGVRFKTLPIYD
jgi:hypothetical protein